MEKIKYKITYIIPYFGKLRNDINLWLETCKYNKTINFLIITDDKTSYKYPDNVKVIYEKFEILKKKINKLLGFEVKLEKAYKLCDFKPAYGEIFSEYITDCDFWGHCDMDMLWGDIRHVVTDDVLNEYDKIGFLGHSTIYRNTPEVNARYKLKINNIGYDYKDVFTSDKSFHFDETYMNFLYKSNGWKIFEEVYFADLTEYHYNFYLTNIEKNRNFDRQIFLWQKGILKRYYLKKHEIKCDNFMYIHFLKRKMNLRINRNSGYENLLIIPNCIINDYNINKINYAFIKKVARPRWGKYFWELYIQKKNTITISNLPGKVIKRLRKYYLLKNNNENLNDNEGYLNKDFFDGQS